MPASKAKQALVQRRREEMLARLAAGEDRRALVRSCAGEWGLTVGAVENLLRPLRADARKWARADALAERLRSVRVRMEAGKHAAEIARELAPVWGVRPLTVGRYVRMVQAAEHDRRTARNQPDRPWVNGRNRAGIERVARRVEQIFRRFADQHADRAVAVPARRIVEETAAAWGLCREPAARKWFRRWLGADEFLNGWERWCLWLGDCPPQELRAMPEAMARVEAVRQFRLASKSPPTRKLALTPTRFHVEFLPVASYLLVPRVSSERRRQIPLGFVEPDTLCSDATLAVPGAGKYHLGIMSSAMHMAWVRQVCGRLKSDYRYSNKLVYNNFPWPEAPTDKQRAAVEARAQAVLDARAAHPGASLADLYDPLTMPPDLTKAHADLDRAVDACYRPAKFESDRQRVEFLFGLYEKLTAPLAAAAAKPKRPRKGSSKPGNAAGA